MQVTATITQKGQVTLPKSARDALGINKFDKVLIEIKKDHIELKPTIDILDIAGTFYPRKNKTKTALDARKYMEKPYKRF